MNKQTPKFIHICTDEKFIDSAISLFNTADTNNHEYIIVTKKENTVYVKNESVVKLTPLKLILYIIKNRWLLKNKVIVLHSTPRLSKLVTLLLPRKTIVVWIGFGHDYYCYVGKTNEKFLLSCFLKRVDFFAPVLGAEYKIVKDFDEGFSAKLLNWNYDVITDFFGNKTRLDGNNILIGNSATISNNHFDVLNKIFKIDLGLNRKVIIPLSYGSDKYKNDVIRYAESLPLDISPLTEFIDIDKYYEILASCSHVLMNHDRQQAYGNILMALYFGSKVFLKENNPLYLHLSEMGFCIFNIESVFDEINIPLGEEEKKLNERLLLKYFSRKEFVLRTKRMIEHIISGG